MNLPTDLAIADLAIAVLGGILVIVLQWAWQWLREQHGVYTGTWDQFVFGAEGEGEPIKHDVVRCRQLGSVIRAKIVRVSPEGQKERTWSFNGRYVRGTLFGHFWAKNERISSFGTIFLRQTSPECFRGFYLRYHQVVEDWGKDSVSINRIPLEWKKRT